jgi:hypothetical protein
MPNANRQRAILAQQKIKQQNTLQPLPDNFTLPKLTAEQRKELFAPKAANTVPEHLQGSEWVRAWRTVERITYGLTAFSALLFGGLVAGESKKAIKK